MSKKRDYTVGRKIEELLNELDKMNISGLKVDRNYATDDVVFINTNDYKSITLSRDEIESSTIPWTTIRNAIDKILPLRNVSSSGSILSATLGTPAHIGGSGGVSSGTISVGGGGGAGFAPPTYVTEYVDKNKLKEKLFSDGERLQIMEVKKTIRTHMNTHMPMRNFDMSHVIVAGGCFASMLNGEVVKDFDVFLLESDTNRAALASIETIENGLNPNGIKVSGSEYMNNDKIEKVVTFGSNAIQYISTKYKNRLELIEHFDFKHCCVSYDYKIDRLFITRETFDLIKSKTLKQNTDKTPVYWRYEKFWQRGWKSEIAIATD
jgi:hypothetical protein